MLSWTPRYVLYLFCGEIHFHMYIYNTLLKNGRMWDTVAQLFDVDFDGLFNKSLMFECWFFSNLQQSLSRSGAGGSLLNNNGGLSNGGLSNGGMQSNVQSILNNSANGGFPLDTNSNRVNVSGFPANASQSRTPSMRSSPQGYEISTYLKVSTAIFWGPKMWCFSKQNTGSIPISSLTLWQAKSRLGLTYLTIFPNYRWFDQRSRDIWPSGGTITSWFSIFRFNSAGQFDPWQQRSNGASQQQQQQQQQSLSQSQQQPLLQQQRNALTGSLNQGMNRSPRSPLLGPNGDPWVLPPTSVSVSSNGNTQQQQPQISPLNQVNYAEESSFIPPLLEMSWFAAAERTKTVILFSYSFNFEAIQCGTYLLWRNKFVARSSSDNFPLKYSYVKCYKTGPIPLVTEFRMEYHH